MSSPICTFNPRSVGGSRSAVMQLAADVSASGSYFGGVGFWLVELVVCLVVVPVVSWLVEPWFVG
jgi:hypothetical protein